MFIAHNTVENHVYRTQHCRKLLLFEQTFLHTHHALSSSLIFSFFLYKFLLIFDFISDILFLFNFLRLLIKLPFRMDLSFSVLKYIIIIIINWTLYY